MATRTGTPGNDTLLGTNQADSIDFSQGGDDTVLAENGNDLIIAGAALAAGDRIDGGKGFDTLTLSGNYGGRGEAFHQDTLTNVEVIRVTAGFNYNLTTHDATVAVGAPLTIDGSALGASNALTVNGAAETDGAFSLIGGAGNDSLTGGARADTLIGGAGSNRLTGGGGDDSINIESGAFDIVSGGDGNDSIFAGGAFTADDRIDGGAGLDTLQLSGSYTAGVTFGANTLTNVEFITLRGGFSYNLTTHDATVTGSQLIVDGSQLFPTNSLTFNGSAERTASFTLRGGAGNDSLMGGAVGDSLDIARGGTDIVFGGSGDDAVSAEAAFTAADQIDGGAGRDFLFLQGSYTNGVVFGATTLTNVEYIGLITGFSYSLTTHDGTVGAGQSLTIDGRGLGANEALTINGAAETDGSFFLDGGAGNDSLTGGAGNDQIIGGAGIDILIGGGGRDVLRGGIGSDTLTGGADDDTFLPFDLPGQVAGDVLTDFEGAGVAGGDRLLFTGSGNTLEHVSGGHDQWQINWGTGQSEIFTISGVSSLSADDVVGATLVPNAAPGTPMDADAGANAVAENAAIGTAVGITASATDPNLSDTVTYSLTDDAGGRFAIDADTGVVTVAGALDFEAAASHDITVEANDGELTSSQSFTIAVTDQNEAPSAPADSDPAIDEVSETAAVGAALGITASATDPDAGDTVTFSLTDNAGGLFAIDQNSGVVTVAGALDFETGAGHNITVEASDGALTSSQSFTIAVTDQNEAPSAPTDSDPAADEVSETAAIGSAVGITASATDPDLGDTVTFSLTNDAGGLFAIDQNSGVVTVAGALDFETAASHQITVEASDGELTSSQSFAIAVTNEAENQAPVARDDFITGDSDLFLTQVGLSSLVFDNNGSGNFGSSVQTIAAPGSHGFDLDDIDGDGDLDAVIAARANGNAGTPASVRVWKNDGEGTFSLTQTLTPSNADLFDVALGDIDGDGDLDALVANSYNRADLVYVNNGSGTFTDSGQRLGLDTTISFSLGDLDGDGDLDAFAANHFSQPDRVYFNNGSGVFTDSGQAIGNFSSSFSALGDVDGDGDLDVAVTTAGGQPNKLYFNDGNGVFTDSGQTLGTAHGNAVAFGDLDGDGDLDLYIGNRNFVADQVFFNDGSGTFTDSGQSIGALDSVNVALSDVDFDGDLDAAVTSFSSPARLFLNNGSGTFSDSGQSLGTTLGWDAALADLDHDGISEDQVVTLDPRANDTDPNGDLLTIDSVDATSAQGAAVSINAQGKVVYDPTAAPALQALAEGETATDSFGYTISDGEGGTASATVTVTVAGENDAPTNIALDNAAVDENAPGAVVGNLTVTDPDTNDTYTFQVSDSRFEVVAGQLKLIDGESLDFETEPSVTVAVTATDGGGLSVEESFIITVNDVVEVEPFPAVFELSSLLPENGGDGFQGFVISGIDAYDISGLSVSGAGDVNGDGIDDLIIGARADPNGQNNAGESYVVFGSAGGFAASLDLAGLNGSNGFVITGVDAGDQSGRSVSGAGDVNGDGVDDLIIGAYRGDPNGQSDAGESYVVFGSAEGFAASLDLSGLDGSNGFVITGVDAGDVSGSSVSGAGDVNGDGVDDLIIGAMHADPNGQSYAGESYVVFGSAQGFAASLDLSSLDGSNGFVLTGIDANDSSGVSVSGAGDINGDGVDDLIIGALGADSNGQSLAGESYVVFGSAQGFAASLDLSNLDGSNGFVLNGIDAFDFSGYSVSGAGDVNGDGVDDLIIGAKEADPNGQDAAGESYVVFGSDQGFAASLDLSGLDGSNGFVITGIDREDRSGRSVGGAGDVNGDGVDDLIIGAYLAQGDAVESGESYVVFGSAEGFAASLDLSTLDGSNGFAITGIDAFDSSGVSVSGAGDVNGDGVDDLVIGSRADPNGQYDAGESYVIFGRDFTGIASLSLADADALV